MRRCLVFGLIVLAGCSTTGDPADAQDTDLVEESDASVDTDATTGKLAIRFAIDSFVQQSMPEGEEPVGRFDGSIWNADDVTVLGPTDGAVDIEGLGVAVDLSTENPTAVLITSGDLPVGFVRILGFLDSDGNAGDPPRPDDKDPVTLPEQNEFEVLPGRTTEITVHFGLLNP